MKIQKIFKYEFFKFVCVGIVNTLAGTGIMLIFFNIFHFGYWISSAANYIFGGIISYFLNKRFTFQCRSAPSKTAPQFILSTVLLYFISYSAAKPALAYILSPFGDKISTNGALLAGAAVFTVLNFFCQKFFVFSKK